MRPSLIINIIAMVFLITNLVLSQESKLKPDTIFAGPTVPSLKDSDVRPKISLQKAMKLMELFLDEENINTSSFFLWEVRMSQFGPPKGHKEDVWHFWWMNVDLADGHDIYIIVSMDGKVRQIPSL